MEGNRRFGFHGVVRIHRLPPVTLLIHTTQPLTPAHRRSLQLLFTSVDCKEAGPVDPAVYKVVLYGVDHGHIELFKNMEINGELPPISRIEDITRKKNG